MKLIKKTILILFICFTVIVIAIYASILYTGSTAKPQKSDALIVLGAQIWHRTPKMALLYRLEKALELYKSGYAPYIIVSGGQGKDEETSEADVMKQWLVEKGVDASKIFEEAKSTSTYENLKFSKEIMSKNNFKSAIIVSNDFHIFRALRLSDRLGIKASGAPSKSYMKYYYQLREIPSVVKSFILDR